MAGGEHPAGPGAAGGDEHDHAARGEVAVVGDVEADDGGPGADGGGDDHHGDEPVGEQPGARGGHDQQGQGQDVPDGLERDDDGAGDHHVEDDVEGEHREPGD